MEDGINCCTIGRLRRVFSNGQIHSWYLRHGVDNCTIYSNWHGHFKLIGDRYIYTKIPNRSTDIGHFSSCAPPFKSEQPFSNGRNLSRACLRSLGIFIFSVLWRRPLLHQSQCQLVQSDSSKLFPCLALQWAPPLPQQSSGQIIQPHSAKLFPTLILYFCPSLSHQSHRQLVECDSSKFLPAFRFENFASDDPDQPVWNLNAVDRLQLKWNEGGKSATGHWPVEEDFPAQILGEAFSIRQGFIVQLGLTSRGKGSQTCCHTLWCWCFASFERLQFGFYRRSTSHAEALQSVFNWLRKQLLLFCPRLRRFGVGNENLRGNNDE